MDMMAGCGDLATLLLRAADIIAQREDGFTDSDSGSDNVVPQLSSRRHFKPDPIRRRSPYDHDRFSVQDYSGSDAGSDDGHAADPDPAPRRGKGRPAGRKAGRGPMQHNEVEKRRRAYLSACYVELKAMLPEIAGQKASNVAILRAAVTQVQDLGATERQLCDERAALLRQRDQLRAQRGLPPAGFIALPEHDAEASSDDGHDSVVPDASRRSVSPDIYHTMSYDSHMVSKSSMDKFAHYVDERSDGGGAMRRRSRARPARFL